jgi:hypothetical protein
MIYPDELMIYKKQGRNALVKVQRSKLQDDVLTYDVLFPNGTVESTTREFLHRPEQPEIANIPVTTENYREAASTLSDEQVSASRKLVTPRTRILGCSSQIVSLTICSHVPAGQTWSSTKAFCSFDQ